MLYTELTNKAIRICFDAHRKKDDKGGIPYVFHPFHLAEQMETEEETCAALLHDVVEDTDMTFADLEEKGFPPAVLDALKLLTHDKGVPYLQYVEALSGNRIAARVKLADLRHNSTAGRLPFIGEKEKKRMRKYLKAQAILTGGDYDLAEMTLRLHYRIPLSDGQKALKEPGGQSAPLTVVLAPDGRVRGYTLVFPAEGREREYRQLYPLMGDLELHGYSTAYAVSCIRNSTGGTWNMVP